MRIYSLLILIITLILSSCTKELDQKTLRHQDAIESTISNSEQKNSNTCNYKLNFNSFEQITKNPSKTTLNPCVMDFLSNYIKQINNNLEISETALKIKELIFMGCNKLTGNDCLYLSKFRNVEGMREFLLGLAKLDDGKDIASYYQLLNAWSDFKNSNIDLTLFGLYLKHTKKYKNIIRHNSDLLLVHNQYIKIILSNANLLIDNSSFTNFILSYNLQLNTNLNEVDMQIIKTLITFGKNNEYKNKLKNFIQNQISILKQKDTFNNKKLKYFHKTLNISSLQYDNYYFLISSAFHSQNSNEVLKIFWKEMNGNAQELSKNVQIYIQLKFLQLLAQSNKIIVKYFHDKKYTANTFFSRALLKSNQALPYFQTFFQQANTLRSFVKSVLLGTSENNSTIYNNLSKDLFDVVKGNVNYMISYPQMMLLLYEFSKQGLELNILTPYSTNYKIPSDKIMDKFFVGEFESFFNYTDLKKPISEEEIVYSFYFALNTGLFRDFAGKNDEHKTIKNFLTVVGQQLTLKHTNEMLNDLRKFAYDFNSNPLYSNLLNLCNDSSSNAHTINLKDTQTSIYQGLKLGELLALKPGFYGSSYERNLERIRTVLQNINLKLSTMINIYEKYLRTLGKHNSSEISSIINELNSILEPINHLKTSFLTNFWNKHNEIDKCYFKIYKQEKKLQENLISYEKAYLANLYEKYHSYKANDQINQLNQELSSHPDYKPLENISNGYFKYTKIDFLMRSRDFIQSGINLNNTHLPPLSNRLKIYVPQTDYDWADHDYYRESQKHSFQIDIDNLSEEEFISSALLKIVKDHVRNPNGFVNWFRDRGYHTFTPYILNFKTQALSSLYKLGDFQIYKKNECSHKFTSAGCKTITVKVSPSDMIKIAHTAKELIHITDSEATILKEIGRKTRINTYQYMYSFLNPMTNSAEDWGALDLIYYSIKEPLLHNYNTFPWSDMGALVQSTLDNRKGSLQMATDYYRAKESRGKLIFNISKNLEKNLDQRYQEIAQHEINKIKEFENAISNDDNNIQALKGEIRYELNKTVSKHILSDLLIDESNAVINNFHQKTNFFYSNTN